LVVLITCDGPSTPAAWIHAAQYFDAARSRCHHKSPSGLVQSKSPSSILGAGWCITAIRCSPVRFNFYHSCHARMEPWSSIFNFIPTADTAIRCSPDKFRLYRTSHARMEPWSSIFNCIPTRPASAKHVPADSSEFGPEPPQLGSGATDSRELAPGSPAVAPPPEYVPLPPPATPLQTIFLPHDTEEHQSLVRRFTGLINSGILVPLTDDVRHLSFLQHEKINLLADVTDAFQSKCIDNFQFQVLIERFRDPGG
jgi:hypothetical protein